MSNNSLFSVILVQIHREFLSRPTRTKNVAIQGESAFDRRLIPDKSLLIVE